MQIADFIDHLNQSFPQALMSEKHTEEDTYIVHVGPDIAITISSDEDTFLLSSNIGKRPQAAEKEVFLQWLASANYLRQATGNSYLHFNPKTEAISLIAQIDTQTPKTLLDEHVEMFCNYAEYWQKALVNYK
jgi:hypothetical protein